MNAKVVRATTKGQITLPKAWREQFKTDNYMMTIKTEGLIIKPVKIEELEEEVLFDAERDNDGKGVPIDEAIAFLEKLQKNG
ncbi:AbrB/MazE/SpoVT family DNA-binding domain-containing protein [Candidatus Peregrinibacteria bacterium]|nr:AbrB/MazE/SpoVT family DNA-binding domain-containing protein [Candidatus Peregrinibacteria bacterium]